MLSTHHLQSCCLGKTRTVGTVNSYLLNIQVVPQPQIKFHPGISEKIAPQNLSSFPYSLAITSWVNPIPVKMVQSSISICWLNPQSPDLKSRFCWLHALMCCWFYNPLIPDVWWFHWCAAKYGKVLLVNHFHPCWSWYPHETGYLARC